MVVQLLESVTSDLILPGPKGIKGDRGILGKPGRDGDQGKTGFKGATGEPKYNGYGPPGPAGQKVEFKCH